MNFVRYNFTAFQADLRPDFYVKTPVLFPNKPDFLNADRIFCNSKSVTEN